MRKTVYDPAELDNIKEPYGRPFEPILKYEEQEFKEDIKRKLKQGLKEFKISGEIIYALNRKNAWRKYMNIHKERIKHYRFLYPNNYKPSVYDQIENPLTPKDCITQEEAFKQKEL